MSSIGKGPGLILLASELVYTDLQEFTEDMRDIESIINDKNKGQG